VCISYQLHLYLATTCLKWPYFNDPLEGHIRQVWLYPHEEKLYIVQSMLYSAMSTEIVKIKCNKGNAKRGVSPRLKIRPCDLDLWPWKSIEFQIFLRSKYVPGLVKIHWRMLILECSQGCYMVKIWPLDLWPWNSIGFQTLLRTMYIPSLVKIHWMMLILECSQGCHTVKNLPSDLDLWPW
jgi:hypothetical protein